MKALLYGLIYSLCNEKGCCWANNKYLAAKLGRKDDSIISKKLKELSDENWLQIEMEKAGNSRKIYLNLEPVTLRKKPEGPTEKTEGYPTEKTEGSSSNVTVSNENEYLTPLPPKTDLAARSAAEERPLTDLFYKTINPNIKWGNKTNIRDEKFLLEKYGKEKCTAAINFLVEHWGKAPMLPTITTPTQLREKMSALIKFKLSQNQLRENKKVKIWTPKNS